MSLREILGEDYREDMTDEEISTAMEKRFLASGKYESKEKVNAERKKALNEKKDLEAKIKAKMSEDELGAKELEDLKAEIEALKAERAENNRKHSKTISSANMSEARTILELKENDKEFEEFLNAISGEDSDLSSKTSSYVMKLVKNAYEKGKALATKENLGEMGKQVIGADGKVIDKDKAFVDSLIKSAPQPVETELSNFN